MNLFLSLTTLLFGAISAFTPFKTKTITPLTTLYSALGHPQSIFSNIPFPIANVSFHSTNLSDENIGEYSSCAPISPLTGRVGTYRIIGVEKNHHVPVDYNCHKSISGSLRHPASVSRLSDVVGGAQVVYTARSQGDRHSPVDYNSHRFISDSEESVDAAQFVSRSLIDSGKAIESSWIRSNGPVDYNSHDAAFTPHSSTGAGRARMFHAPRSLGDRHIPVDYNFHKFISNSEASVDAVKFVPRSLTVTGGNAVSSYNARNTIPGSVRSAPFFPHSSTGAGGTIINHASSSGTTHRRP